MRLTKLYSVFSSPMSWDSVRVDAKSGKLENSNQRRIRLEPLMSIIGLLWVLLSFAASSFAQSPPFLQCPPIGLSSSCAVLIVINPNGSLRFLTDPSVPPFDGVEDTLVGVQNNSGATVFGISITGPGIFDFDGDGAGSGGSYEGPNTSFTLKDSNSGIVNFTGNGLANNQGLWFSLEGAPSQVRLTSSVTIDPGHGTINCPKGRTGATGPTNYTTPPVGHLQEYVLTMSVGLQLQASLSAAGYQVTMTKTNVAACPTYAERTSIANKAHSNMFVSIHFDGVSNPTVNGTSVLYPSQKTSAQQLASFIVNQIAYNLGVSNKGVIIRNDLAVLRATMSHMTSVLAEVATISNVGGDEDKMHNPASIGLAAGSIFAGIDAFVNQ